MARVHVLRVPGHVTCVCRARTNHRVLPHVPQAADVAVLASELRQPAAEYWAERSSLAWN